MGLADKLDKRAKELDQRLKQALLHRDYNMQVHDDRELLEQAAKRIRKYEEIARDVRSYG